MRVGQRCFAEGPEMNIRLWWSHPGLTFAAPCPQVRFTVLLHAPVRCVVRPPRSRSRKRARRSPAAAPTSGGCTTGEDPLFSLKSGSLSSSALHPSVHPRAFLDHSRGVLWRKAAASWARVFSVRDSFSSPLSHRSRLTTARSRYVNVVAGPPGSKKKGPNSNS